MDLQLAVVNETTVLLVGGFTANGVCLRSTEVYTYGHAHSVLGPAMLDTEAIGSAFLTLNASHVLQYGGRICSTDGWSSKTRVYDLEANTSTILSWGTNVLPRYKCFDNF